MNRNRIIVFGCGVIGLSTALRLQQRGERVSIVTRDLPPTTTSHVAPAMWHPYKVAPDERMRRWAGTAFRAFKELSTHSASGVRPSTIREYYATKTDQPWYADAVDSIRRLSPSELPPGYIDGFSTESFVIDSSVYLNFLLERFQAKGGLVVQRSLDSFEEFIHSHSTIVNCTGLASRELARDASVYPISGQVLRVASAYQQSSTCVIDENGARAVCYVVPRSGDVLLGGTAIENDWNTYPNADITADILRKAQELVPELSDAVVIESMVGLRSARPTVRLERDAQYPWLIHNYGHSGAGYTLSWGCAEEVATLVQESATVSALTV